MPAAPACQTWRAVLRHLSRCCPSSCACVRNALGLGSLCRTRPRYEFSWCRSWSPDDPDGWPTHDILTTAPPCRNGYCARFMKPSGQRSVRWRAPCSSPRVPPRRRLHRAPSFLWQVPDFQPATLKRSVPSAVPAILFFSRADWRGGGRGVTSPPSIAAACWRPLALGFSYGRCPAAFNAQASGRATIWPAGQAALLARAQGPTRRLPARLSVRGLRNPQMMQASCLWRTTATEADLR